MTEQIQIAILDDDNLFVEGIAALLETNSAFDVVYKANNPLVFIEYLEQTEKFPDIILLDLNMKPITGLEVLELLNQKQITIKTIVLSSLFNPSMYGYMIKHSISAFLPKYIEKQELFHAIEYVFHHKFYMNEENQQLINEYLKVQKKNLNPWNSKMLSDREIDVLLCICNEMSTKEIAEKLFISIKTVESHRSKLMEKIGCKNAIGMVIYAILGGLFTFSEIRENPYMG